MSKTLTIVASNRDRLDFTTDSGKLFLASLEAQVCQDFEVIISDGGSKNLEDLEEFLSQRDKSPNIRIVKEKLGDKFERARLNNVGVRSATTPYIMSTDVDMCFAATFVEELLSKVGPNIFVESRTRYWKRPLVNKIYAGKIDPFTDLESCMSGRIKKRTTAGGCQCAHIDQWTKVRGFDESFIGWGSEDYDLLTRMTRSGADVVWMGELPASSLLFHQPHGKPNMKEDLECQAKNKRLLNKAINGKSSFTANPNGWGGIYSE